MVLNEHMHVVASSSFLFLGQRGANVRGSNTSRSVDELLEDANVALNNLDAISVNEFGRIMGCVAPSG